MFYWEEKLDTKETKPVISKSRVFKICLMFPFNVSFTSDYHHNLVALGKISSSCKIVVLADKQRDAKSKEFHNFFRVLRIWNPKIINPFELFKATYKERPALVHTHYIENRYGRGPREILLYPYMLFLALTRIPLVITLQVCPRRYLDELLQKYGIRNTFERTLYKFGYVSTKMIMGKLASAIITHNNYSVSILKKDYFIPGDKIEMIPYPLPASNGLYEISKKGLRNQRKVKRSLGLEDKSVLLFFGFVTPRKGIEHAMKAMPYILEKKPDVVLLIVGPTLEEKWDIGATYFADLKRLVKEIGVEKNIVFINRFVSDEFDISVYFTAADIVVLPYIETFGASGVIGLASIFGKPVITTASPSREDEIVNGLTGILIPPGDSEAIANAVLDLLLKPKKRKNIGQAFNELMKKRCSWKKVAFQTLSVYEKVTNIISHQF